MTPKLMVAAAFAAGSLAPSAALAQSFEIDVPSTEFALLLDAVGILSLPTGVDGFVDNAFGLESPFLFNNEVFTLGALAEGATALNGATVSGRSVLAIRQDAPGLLAIEWEARATVDAGAPTTGQRLDLRADTAVVADIFAAVTGLRAGLAYRLTLEYELQSGADIPIFTPPIANPPVFAEAGSQLALFLDGVPVGSIPLSLLDTPVPFESQPGTVLLSRGGNAANTVEVVFDAHAGPSADIELRIQGFALPETLTTGPLASAANAVGRGSLSLAVAPIGCPADFNDDGENGDIFDLFDFLAALDTALDYNLDGQPADIFDLFDFLSDLDAGCP